MPRLLRSSSPGIAGTVVGVTAGSRPPPAWATAVANPTVKADAARAKKMRVLRIRAT